MKCLPISACLFLLIFFNSIAIQAQVREGGAAPNVIEGGGPPPCGSLNNFPRISNSFVEIEGNTASVTVWWGQNGATWYEVINDVGGDGCAIGTSPWACKTTGLPLGRTVEFYVHSSRMCTSQLEGLTEEFKDSNPVSITLPPAAPMNLVSGALSNTSFKATWSASTGATSYRLDVSLSPGFSPLIVNDMTVSSTSQVLTGMMPNTTYYFRVRAVNSGGVSTSNSSSILISVPTILANPQTIKYENPEGVQLSTEAGHTDYKWFLGGVQISGANTNTLQATTIGNYSTSWCVSYSDGTRQCNTASFNLEGETLTVNYFQKKITQVGNITTLDQLNDPSNTNFVTTITDYADGLARPIQHVERGSSPLGNDVVTISTYDAFSRSPKQYLPFTRRTNDGNYMYMPISVSPIFNFYQKSDDKIADTTVPFAESAIESSPLNRVRQQGSAGEEWQISNNHAKSFNYTTNTASDKVFVWQKTSDGIIAFVYYPAGTLTVTETTDEDGNHSREFKDKDGRVVLSERTIEAGAKLRTYYVFDDMGRLQFVLPPKTISELPDASTVIITPDKLARECYSYQYDDRSRQTVKNIPGAGSTYMIYDKWDRLALTQSANQRAAGKWTFNKYDGLDRIIMTGEIALPGNYAAVQQVINTLYANIQANPALRYEELNGSMHGYTNRSFPVLSNQFQAYTISYYDNYNFLSQFGTGYQFQEESSIGVANYSSLARSLVTGTKVLILGGQTYLKAVNYYDSKHRVIQVISDNHQGGIDRVTSSLDFIGKIMRTRERHNGLQPVIIDQEFSYDHMGRPINAYHTINNGTKVLLSNKRYNELGQMIEQNIHSTDGNTFLQSQDYVYNIRGWLLNVNPLETESNVQFQDQYGFELSYTAAPAVSGLAGFRPAFNGNITAFTEVRPGSTNLSNEIFKNGFSYQYDARNQLTQANYFQVAGPAQTHNSTFDMPAINYDPNGNITFLKRMGITTGGNAGIVDELHYNYNGNQLIGVTDGGDHSRGFIKK